MTALTEENRQRLMQVATSTLTTVLFRKGFRTRFIAGVAPVNPQAARFVGPAFTLRYIPAREDIDTMARCECRACPAPGDRGMPGRRGACHLGFRG